MNSLTVPAKTEYMPQVNEFIDIQLEALGCPGAVQMQIDLAVEEIFVNIASYAYEAEDGKAEIRCDVMEDPVRVEIQFLDSGMPYDPLARPDADTSPEALMGRVGGLGILLVKTTMDDVQYSYEGGKNILTIRKKL